VQPKPLLRWLAVAAAMGGWCISLLLMQAVSGAARGSPLLDRLCGGGATDSALDCRSVLASPYGSFPLSPQENAPRLPVSTLGMAYFAALGLWFLFVGPPTRSRAAWHLLPLAGATVGVLVSAYYVSVMAFTLQQWCLWCMATHALNAVLFVSTLAATPWRPTPAATPHPTARLVGATAAAGLALAFAHVAAALTFVAGSSLSRLSEAYRKIVENPDYVVWDWQRQPAVKMPPTPDGAFVGPREALLSVVVFSDFQCARCRALHDVLARLAADPNASVRFATRHFPLDGACHNDPRYRAGAHADACRAAAAVEAARAVGGDEAAARMTALLFAKRGRLAGEASEQWAREAGLNVGDFTAVRATAERRVAADIDAGRALRVQDTGVPLAYVNGRRCDGWSVAPAWLRLLAAAQTAEETP
jgi:uncharacterized membrane protein